MHTFFCVCVFVASNARTPTPTARRGCLVRAAMSSTAPETLTLASVVSVKLSSCVTKFEETRRKK